MTQEELLVIDTIVSAPALPHPTHCNQNHPEVDLLDPALRSIGFIAYANLPCFAERSKYEKSYWLRREDGRSVPEIYVLATLRYGLLSVTQRAYWTDGDWTNSCVENVSVTTVKLQGKKKLTPQERYYSNPVNKERHRLRMREYARKKREILKRAKEHLSQQALEELEQSFLPPDGRVGPDDERAFGLSVPGPDDSDLLAQLEEIAEEKLQE